MLRDRVKVSSDAGLSKYGQMAAPILGPIFNVDFKTDINITDKFHLFVRYGYMQADVSGVFGLGAAGGDLHIWVYDDLNQRASARGALLQDPDWQAFVAKGSPLLADMQTTILIPTSISPLR